MNQNFTEPIIVLKTVNLYQDFYQEVRKWPKPEKYNLGAKCEQILIDLLTHFLAAARHINPKFNLIQANLQLQLLKLLIRIAKNIDIIQIKKYLFFEQKIVEIGKMLGGWLKNLK